NAGAAFDQPTPGRPQWTNAAAVNGGAARAQPDAPAAVLGDGGAGPGKGKHALNGPNSPRGAASGLGSGKHAPAGPNVTAVPVANGGAAPDQHTPGRPQGVDAASVNGGKQVPSAPPGAADGG